MEEFVGEYHKQRKHIKDYFQAPFIVVHDFRHLIAKQRRKALRKSNNLRKKMLMPPVSSADTQIEAQESKKLPNQWGESLWDVFILEESIKNKSQTQAFDLLVQSKQNQAQGDSSSVRSERKTTISEIPNSRKELFAQQFLPFSYQYA